MMVVKTQNIRGEGKLEMNQHVEIEKQKWQIKDRFLRSQSFKYKIYIHKQSQWLNFLSLLSPLSFSPISPHPYSCQFFPKLPRPQHYQYYLVGDQAGHVVDIVCGSSKVWQQMFLTVSCGAIIVDNIEVNGALDGLRWRRFLSMEVGDWGWWPRLVWHRGMTNLVWRRRSSVVDAGGGRWVCWWFGWCRRWWLVLECGIEREAGQDLAGADDGAHDVTLHILGPDWPLYHLGDAI